MKILTFNRRKLLVSSRPVTTSLFFVGEVLPFFFFFCPGRYWCFLVASLPDAHTSLSSGSKYTLEVPKFSCQRLQHASDSLKLQRPIKYSVPSLISIPIPREQLTNLNNIPGNAPPLPAVRRRNSAITASLRPLRGGFPRSREAVCTFVAR